MSHFKLFDYDSGIAEPSFSVIRGSRLTARNLFFGKRKYFYQIPGHCFIYKISVIREVCQLVKPFDLKVIQTFKFVYNRHSQVIWVNIFK